MEVPYYLQPTVESPGDVVFNIPITTSPPSVVYDYEQVKSIWEQGLDGAGSLVDKAQDFATEAVSTTIDVLRRGKENVVGLVNAPIEAIQSAFNYTLWLTIAGVLTLVYLVVK